MQSNSDPLSVPIRCPVAAASQNARIVLTRLTLRLRGVFGLLRGTFLRFGAWLVAFEALPKCVHQVDY
jgi:hypothetical protein